MLSTKLINLHSIMFTIISLVISSTSILSKVITPKAFMKYKNPMLGTLSLAISSHVTTDNAQTIWIHKQAFASWSDA